MKDLALPDDPTYRLPITTEAEYYDQEGEEDAWINDLDEPDEPE